MECLPICDDIVPRADREHWVVREDLSKIWSTSGCRVIRDLGVLLHFGAACSEFCFLTSDFCSNVYGIWEAVYATIFIMSSVVKLATTGFISSVHVPLRKPCCMSNIWRIK